MAQSEEAGRVKRVSSNGKMSHCYSIAKRRYSRVRSAEKCSPKIVQRFASARPPHGNAPIDFLRKTAQNLIKIALFGAF